MSWNYRVMKLHNGDHVICEAYYDSTGRLNGWSTAVEPMGETAQELAQDLTLMQYGCGHPVLLLEDLEAAGRQQPGSAKTRGITYEADAG